MGIRERLRNHDERYATPAETEARTMGDVGALLRRRRKELRWTQEEAAGFLGRSTRLVSDMEHGRGSVGFEKVLEYANGLGIDLVLRVRGK